MGELNRKSEEKKMSKIGSLITSLEANEQQFHKFEELLRQDKEHFVKLCTNLILYIMKNVPAKYERKIFSFLYENVYIQDENGYKYCANIPNKRECDNWKFYLSGYGGTRSHNIEIDRYFLLKQNNVQYICVDLTYEEYDPFDEDFTANLGRYILPVEQIDWAYNLETIEDKETKAMNKRMLDKWLDEKVKSMENFIEEEEQIEKENAEKHKEQYLKELHEKEYQEYLRLKEKFDNADL